VSSHPPGYDEHFAALAAGHGPASWADPAEPDGTARRARQRGADRQAEHPATRAVRRRPVGGRARRAALVAVAIVSLIASAGLAAELLVGAEPAPQAALDTPRAGRAKARPSTRAPSRCRAVRSWRAALVAGPRARRESPSAVVVHARTLRRPRARPSAGHRSPLRSSRAQARRPRRLNRRPRGRWSLRRRARRARRHRPASLRPVSTVLNPRPEKASRVAESRPDRFDRFDGRGRRVRRRRAGARGRAAGRGGDRQGARRTRRRSRSSSRR